MEINSLTNSKVKQWAKYKEKKYREQDACFLIEGEHLIMEAHNAKLIDVILVEQGKASPITGYETYEVTSEILKKLCASVSGTWIMAICHYPEHMDVKMGDHIILLDDVQDPGNVGTIIRSAYSFGYDSIVLSPRCVDIFNEKVIRSTQGALFHLPIIRASLEDTIKELKQHDVAIYATSLHQASPLSQVRRPKKIALIFGNEGQGVSQEILELSDGNVYVEMVNFESLNVAVAAGICMYHFKK